MDWKEVEKNDAGQIKVPKRWLKLEYYEALNILFRFENSLRVFVYAVLKNEYLHDWKNCQFSPPGGGNTSIKALAAKRIAQAETFGYLGYDIRSPLMHLTSGELAELIVSDAYWKHFRQYFRGRVEIIKNKLLEIGNVRNSLAHFRPIQAGDIGLVKQNSRHVLLGVEDCLSNLFLANRTRVPTNTVDDWYQAVRTLGTDHVSIIPEFSNDEKWINLKLDYHLAMLSRTGQEGGAWYGFAVANLNSPKILSEHKDLAVALTYLNEAPSHPTLTQDFRIDISKTVNLVFRRDILTAKHELIVAELTRVLQTISEEVELLHQDNDARGKLMEVAKGSFSWREPQGNTEGRWQHYFGSLGIEYLPEHPDEYWGQQYYWSDVVAASRRYPWMPTDISEREGLFDFL